MIIIALYAALVNSFFTFYNVA